MKDGELSEKVLEGNLDVGLGLCLRHGQYMRSRHFASQRFSTLCRVALVTQVSHL